MIRVIRPFMTVCCVIVVASHSQTSLAQNKFDAVAPFVNGNTIAVAQIDLERVNVTEALRLISDLGPTRFRISTEGFGQAVRDVTSTRDAAVREGITHV